MDNMEMSEIIKNKSLLNEKWELIDIPFLRRTYDFQNFNEAFKFVNLVAEISEKLKHHPDIFISFNKVNLNIYTHDTDSLTNLDFQLALAIDEIYSEDELAVDDDLELLDTISILKKGSDFERRRAATKLGRIGNPKAIKVLIKALKDHDRSVRRAAARSLGKLKDKHAISALIKVLGNADGDFRYAAKESLVEIGEASENDLILALDSKNNYQREMAVEALGELGSENSSIYLKKCLLDEDSKVRWRAARAVNQWYDDELIGLLKNISQKDHDVKVRDESVKSLITIKNRLQEIYNTFIKSIKFINEDIEIRKTKTGNSFLINGKVFCSSHPYNSTKIHIWIYKGKLQLKDVKNMKDPRWGIIYLQKKEELGNVLETIKESYMISKEDF